MVEFRYRCDKHGPMRVEKPLEQGERDEYCDLCLALAVTISLSSGWRVSSYQGGPMAPDGPAPGALLATRECA